MHEKGERRFPTRSFATSDQAPSGIESGGLRRASQVQVAAGGRHPQIVRTSGEPNEGSVAVTYYDFRNNTSDPATLWTDYFAVHCHSGCSNPANWGNEARLSDISFDMRQAPFAGGFFTGDYEGLAAEGNDFLPFFSQTHGADPGSIFFRRVGP